MKNNMISVLAMLLMAMLLAGCGKEVVKDNTKETEVFESVDKDTDTEESVTIKDEEEVEETESEEENTNIEEENTAIERNPATVYHIETIIKEEQSGYITKEYYDYEGNILKSEKWGTDGTLILWYQVDYREDEIVTAEYIGNDTLSEMTFQEYDENGNIYKKLIYDSSGVVSYSIYVYDEYGRVIECTTFDGNDDMEGAMAYVYYKDGSYLKTSFNELGEETYSALVGEDGYIDYKEYVGYPRVNYTTDIKRDEWGNVLQVMQYDENGVTYIKDNFSYDYDEYGNILCKYTLNEAGEIKTTETMIYYEYLANGGEKIEGYDIILAKTLDYVIVAKDDSGFEAQTIKVGVLNGDMTEWIWPLSENGIFFQQDGWGRSAVYLNNKDKLIGAEFEYIGDDMFVATTSISADNSNASLAFYNVDNNSGFMVPAKPVSYDYGGNTAMGANYDICFENGWAIYVDADKNIFSVDKQGNQNSLNLTYKQVLGKYSAGLFFYSDGFYDCNGTKIIDLSQYSTQIYEYYTSNSHFREPYFQDINSTVKVFMLGADKEVYYIEVDHSGNFITDEPQKY